MEERDESGRRCAQVPAAEVPADAFLLDVREPDEWDSRARARCAAHPAGRAGRPLSWRSTAAAEVYVICRSGDRSDHAARALAGAGWQALNVSDGMIGWQATPDVPMTSESGQPFVA